MQKEVRFYSFTDFDDEIILYYIILHIVYVQSQSIDNFGSLSWPQPHQLSSSQYSASSMNINLKFMHFSIKDLSWGLSWVIWKFWWRWGPINNKILIYTTSFLLLTVYDII